MFKSKRQPRIGDFIKMILIREPQKFTSFESIYLFLVPLYDKFEFDFFNEEYFEALVPEPESEPEPEPESEPEPSLGNDHQIQKNEDFGGLDMTGQKSNKIIDPPSLKPPSFGNINNIEKDVKVNQLPNLDIKNDKLPV